MRWTCLLTGALALLAGVSACSKCDVGCQESPGGSGGSATAGKGGADDVQSGAVKTVTFRVPCLLI